MLVNRLLYLKILKQLSTVRITYAIRVSLLITSVVTLEL